MIKFCSRDSSNPALFLNSDSTRNCFSWREFSANSEGHTEINVNLMEMFASVLMASIKSKPEEGQT